MSSAENTGSYRLIVPSMDRQLAMDAFAALPQGHPMVGLMELDVTDALVAIGKLREQGVRVTVFAFVIRCIAQAISEHPQLNLVRHGKRLVAFDDVDIAVPVEVSTPDGNFPRQVVLRRAQDCTPQELSAKLDAARSRHRETGAASEEDRFAHRLERVLRWIPRILRIAAVRWLLRSAFRIKARGGTTLVTSVGKFAAIPGYSFTFTTGPRAASFVVGGAVDKPWVHEGALALRSIVSVSLIVDHDLVDGAPVARFATRLQALIESAEGLVPKEIAASSEAAEALATRTNVRVAGA